MSAAAMRAIALDAKKSCQALSLLSPAQKEKALRAMAQELLKNRDAILHANGKDVEAAKKKGLAPALVARLALDGPKLRKIVQSLESISRLADPVGRVIWEKMRPNGLRIQKIAVPLGTILIIYESRPNVTDDCMALCLKSANSVRTFWPPRRNGRQRFSTVTWGRLRSA